jgi:hypothetical protein
VELPRGRQRRRQESWRPMREDAAAAWNDVLACRVYHTYRLISGALNPAFRKVSDGRLLDFKVGNAEAIAAEAMRCWRCCGKCSSLADRCGRRPRGTSRATRTLGARRRTGSFTNLAKQLSCNAPTPHGIANLPGRSDCVRIRLGTSAKWDYRSNHGAGGSRGACSWSLARAEAARRRVPQELRRQPLRVPFRFQPPLRRPRPQRGTNARHSRSRMGPAPIRLLVTCTSSR